MTFNLFLILNMFFICIVCSFFIVQAEQDFYNWGWGYYAIDADGVPIAGRPRFRLEEVYMNWKNKNITKVDNQTIEVNVNKTIFSSIPQYLNPEIKDPAWFNKYYSNDNPFRLEEKDFNLLKLIYSLELNQNKYNENYKKYIILYRFNETFPIVELRQTEQIVDNPRAFYNRNIQQSIYLYYNDLLKLTNFFMQSHASSNTFRWVTKTEKFEIDVNRYPDYKEPYFTVAQKDFTDDHSGRRSYIVYDQTEFMHLLYSLGGVLYDVGLGF